MITVRAACGLWGQWGCVWKVGGAKMPDAVTVEVSGGVAVLTINRPQARNAINEAAASGIAAAIDELDPRPDVAAMVLTGAGGTFSAGMDLKGFMAGENPTAGGRGFAGVTQRPPAPPPVAPGGGDAPARGVRIAPPRGLSGA